MVRIKVCRHASGKGTRTPKDNKDKGNFIPNQYCLQKGEQSTMRLWLLRFSVILTSTSSIQQLNLFSRGHATLHLAVSVGRSVGPSVRLSVRPSVTFLNYERFSHYCSCPTVRDWIAVYPALFFFCGQSYSTFRSMHRSILAPF